MRGEKLRTLSWQPRQGCLWRGGVSFSLSFRFVPHRLPWVFNAQMDVAMYASRMVSWGMDRLPGFLGNRQITEVRYLNLQVRFRWSALRWTFGRASKIGESRVRQPDPWFEAFGMNGVAVGVDPFRTFSLGVNGPESNYWWWDCHTRLRFFWSEARRSRTEILKRVISGIIPRIVSGSD